MKNNIKITLLVLTILIIICLTYFLTNNNQKNKKLSVTNIVVDKTKQIKICNDISLCENEYNYYPKISLDTNSRELKKNIKKLNNSTDKLYNESNSKLNEIKNCSSENIKNYISKYLTNIQYFYYIDDNVFSLAKTTNNYDLCTDKLIEDNLDVYIYDVKTSKQITKEELLSIYNILESDILEVIEKSVKSKNENGEFNYTIEDMYDKEHIDYQLYLDNDGNIKIRYHCSKNNNYYTTTMNIK